MHLRPYKLAGPLTGSTRCHTRGAKRNSPLVKEEREGKKTSDKYTFKVVTHSRVFLSMFLSLYTIRF